MSRIKETVQAGEWDSLQSFCAVKPLSGSATAITVPTAFTAALRPPRCTMLGKRRAGAQTKFRSGAAPHCVEGLLRLVPFAGGALAPYVQNSDSRLRAEHR
eukprot:COSAG04_NODE_7944_length_1044_cov_0.980952_3_plen_101_part_00